MQFLKKLFVEEKAQGMTEYALILGLIVLGVWVAVTATGIGPAITAIFTAVSGAVGNCTSGSCP
ncbi:MAG TPA: Flp family type IVb pilin [Candidatus Binatia bacterium]|jgi:Flp pilus assembly pilin Flp